MTNNNRKLQRLLVGALERKLVVVQLMKLVALKPLGTGKSKAPMVQDEQRRVVKAPPKHKTSTITTRVIEVENSDGEMVEQEVDLSPREVRKANRGVFKSSWIESHGDLLVCVVDSEAKQWAGAGVVEGVDADQVNLLMQDESCKVVFGCKHCFVMGKGRRDTAPQDKFAHGQVITPDVGKMGIHQRSAGHQQLKRMDLLKAKLEEKEKQKVSPNCIQPHTMWIAWCLGI